MIITDRHVGPHRCRVSQLAHLSKLTVRHVTRPSHTHTELLQTRLTALCPGLPGWAGTNLDFTKARDSKWQCYQLGHMQVCTSIQTAHHRSVFLQAGCPSCRPTNSVKSTEGTSVDRKKKSHYSDLFALAGYFSQAVDKISAAAECRAGPSATAGAWTGWVCCVKVKVNVRR